MGGIVIVDTVSGGTTDGANKDLSNLSVTGQAVIDGKANTNLMNTNFVTNGILSAPNGVATYSGLQLQLPAGTVLACPDGINADGTRKSIVVTTASLLTVTTTAINGVLFKAYYNQVSGVIGYVRTDTTFYYEKPTTPTGMSSGALWYNNSPSVNKCYIYNGSTWDEHPFVVIADFSYTGGAISGFKAKYPVELLKVSDTDSLLDKVFISKKIITNIINLTVTTTAQTYTLPDNGYLELGSDSTTTNIFVSIYNYTDNYTDNYEITVMSNMPGGTRRYLSPLLKKGTIIDFRAGSGSATMANANFIYANNS